MGLKREGRRAAEWKGEERGNKVYSSIKIIEKTNKRHVILAMLAISESGLVNFFPIFVGLKFSHRDKKTGCIGSNR